MKKLSISLLVMLLIASLFTSCSMGSDDASDVRVKVRLTPSGGGRSLTTDIETINLDDDSITWHYSATKVSETQFNYGATSDSLLPKDGIVTLSQGEWNIELRGFKDGKNVFAGTIDKTIKWNFYEPNVTVQVPVNENTGDKGFIVLTDVKIPVNEELKTPNFASIDTTIITNLNGANMRIECAPGSHTITFAYKEEENVKALKSLVVTVISGRETTISGNIDESEITSGGSSAPTSEVQVIEVKKEAEVKVETSVAPAQSSSSTGPQNKTTVTFPAGSFNDDSSNAVLNLSVKSAGKITVTSTEVPVFAGIDISLLVNNQPVTEFNGKEVVIETYIAKDLTKVSVKYNGTDGDQPIATDADVTDKTVAALLSENSPATALGYNKETGLLRFKTNHFSEYYVLATVVALNVNTGVPYTSLASAINAASDNSIIELMTDVVVDGVDPVIINTSTSNKLEINLNGNSITGNGMRALWVKAGDVSITGTGTISSTEGIDDDSSVIRVADSSSNGVEAKLTIGSNVVVSSDYSYAITVFGLNKGTLVVDGTIRSNDVPAISGNGISSLNETDITINGSVETINENAIYHPQAGSLTINGTVTGKGGIEAKSGNIIINSKGKVIATSDVLSHDKNSNGCSTQGYAIAAVNNNKYKSNVLVEIKDGAEITGKVALKHDSESLSEGKSKAVIHSESSSYSKETNSMWLKLYSDSFYTLMEKWDDYAANKYATPVDDANKVVTIASAEELALFASQVKGGNSYSGYTVNLTNDIDLSGKLWTPIGNSEHYFKGTFDGKDHKISNLVINTSSSNTGFFSVVSNAIIKNLKINNAYVNSDYDSVGILTGKAYSGVTISNIEVTGKIFVSGGYYVGGINGGYSYARYENCTVDGSNTENYQSIIKSTLSGGYTNYVGGICGLAGEGGRGIYNCDVKNITLQTTNGGYGIGGIAGVMQYNYTISDCTVDNVNLVHLVDADDAVEWIGTIGGKDYTKNSNTISKIINCLSQDVSVYVGNNLIDSSEYWVMGNNHIGTYDPFEQYEANLVVGNEISYDEQDKFISGNVIFVGANAKKNAANLLANGYKYVLNEDGKSYSIQSTNSN